MEIENVFEVLPHIVQANTLAYRCSFTITLHTKIHVLEEGGGGLSKLSKTFILCTISLAISNVSHLFCAHLCAVPINFNCNDENRILGK